MKPRKLYITDLDGTLLNNESIVSDRSRELLNEAGRQGALITVATARTPATVDKLLNGIRLRIPAIVMTGAATWDLAERRYCDVHTIDKNICRHVEDICSTCGIRPFVYTLSGNGKLDVFYRSDSGYNGLSKAEKSFVDERRNLPLKQFHFSGRVTSEHMAVLYLAIAPIEMIMEAGSNLRAIGISSVSAYPDIFNPSTGILEVYANGVSKASAVKEMKQKTECDILTVFGDNLNDIPMMEVADIAIAVENALPQVKDMADIVIGPNSENSVASYILNDCLKS